MSAIFEDATLTDLVVQQTQADIYAAFLQIAATLGLPVTSWQTGDPTRSTFYIEAQLLETLEEIVVGFIQSGFLDYAGIPNPDGTANPWLAVVAKQGFGVDVPAAQFAETTETLVNSGSQFFEVAAGDLHFKNSTSGATYTSTSGLMDANGNPLDALVPGATAYVTLIADLAGSASTASAGEIDTLITTLPGVTCTNVAAAVGVDAQDPATTVQQCRNKAGSFSPNGPASAYDYVALNPALTGISTVTRSRTYPDSETGDVLVYVAGPSGSVGGSDVAAVLAAITRWATPLTVTPTVQSATNVVVPVTYTIWLYQSVGQTTAQIQAKIQTALQLFFLLRPIGGDIIPPATTGVLYQSMIEAVIGSCYPNQTFKVLVSAPSSDTALTNGQVAALGTVTSTVNLIAGP